MSLQAVIVADSYNRRFDPLTHSRPRALLPLCNVPLIDYVLGLLASNGVSEVFVVACSHAESIHAHLESVSPKYKSMKINCIVSQGSYNFGDALRDLETRQLINSDFILVTGDIVSNYKLRSVIAEHKKRAEVDKDFLMTMLLTQCDHDHPVRSIEEDIFIITDPDNQRLLYYESPEGSIRVPLSTVMERSRVELQYDLVESHIYICTPLMLMQFADNFDYANVFDFIKGVIENEEIVPYKIHTAVSPKYYATRCANLTSYDAISQDVMNRWTYPLVPDLFAPDEKMYEYKRNNIYVQEGCILGRACRLVGTVVVGAGSVIANDEGGLTTIRGSVLGKSCTIGTGTKLMNAYLLNNVKIGNNCVIDHALIGEGVIIHDGVQIPHGCVIGDGVELGPGISLEKHTRVSLEFHESNGDMMPGFVEVDMDDEGHSDADSVGKRVRQLSILSERDELDNDTDVTEDEDSAGDMDTTRVAHNNENGYDITVVGEKGRGHAFVPQLLPAERSEHTLWKEARPRKRNTVVYPSALPTSHSEISTDALSEDNEDTDSLADALQPEPSLTDADLEFEEFYHEVLDIIKARVSPDNVGKTPIDAVKLEITGSRAAHSMMPNDVCCAIVRALIVSAAGLETKKCGVYLLQLFKTMSPILENYIHTKMDHMICIQNVLEFCIENEHAKPYFMKLLHTLYENNVLEEEPLLEWYAGNDPGADTTSDMAILYKQLEPFMRWLKEAETDTEGSEEDEDDEDEDDEDEDE
eukprot:m.72633 g.72633  ORF g.72633 m.72633 type:complete len:754 (-) comp13863_c0_seq1:333-2594(-)